MHPTHPPTTIWSLGSGPSNKWRKHDEAIIHIISSQHIGPKSNTQMPTKQVALLNDEHDRARI